MKSEIRGWRWSILLFATLAALLPGVGAQAAPAADDVIGVWLDQDQRGYIEIFREQGSYHGRIAGSAVGPVGLDINNPDPAQRGRSLMGKRILQGLRYDGAGRWLGGTILNPDDGQIYSVKLELPQPDLLDVRGFIGTPMFGQTQRWTRVHGAIPPARGMPPNP
ncbi:MAG TPA: DUF2147 domain-containing protein [Solimonas sp.]